MIIFPIFFFILGTIIGSFVNVLVLRYGTGLSPFAGRSQCFSCGKTLSAFELIPVISFLAMGGRCSSCKSRISVQYPLVEAGTGVLFLLLFLAFGFSAVLPLYLFASVFLVAIFVYDLRHMIIPDSFAFLLAVISLALVFFRGATAIDLLSGPILFAFFGSFWLFSRGRWMGFGDAKLALGIGWLLPFSAAVFATLASFWIGALWSILVMGIGMVCGKRTLTLRTAVPFAPFLIIAAVLTLVLHLDFSQLMSWIAHLS